MRVLLLLLLFLSACSYSDRIAALEKQNKDMRKDLDAQKQVVDLDTQAKCSTAAKSFFADNFRWEKVTILLDYSNHYNKVLGKCFILIENHSSTSPKSDSWYNMLQIHDVYQKSTVAELTERHNLVLKDFSTQVSLLRCEVDGQTCISSDDFTQKSRHYMVD